jgi:hypothetical protein
MSKLFEGLFIGIIAIVLIGAIAVFSGTIVYFIWPYVVPAVLPKLVTTGVIAGQLTWGQSVLLTWLCSILIKSSQTNNNKS